MFIFVCLAYVPQNDFSSSIYLPTNFMKPLFLTVESKKNETYVSQDPAIPLQGIYANNTPSDHRTLAKLCLYQLYS